MKYTTLSENGTPRAFYDDAIHAYIPNGAIEITDDQWLECINNSGKRKFVNGLLVEYVYVETLKEKKASKLNEINAEYEQNVLKIANVGKDEMATWPKQEAEARAWLADNSSATPVIDNLMIGRSALGESKAELVAKIIANADAYSVAFPKVLGLYQAKQKALEACTTLEQVLAL